MKKKETNPPTKKPKKAKKHYAEKGKTRQADIFDWLEEEEKPKKELDI